MFESSRLRLAGVLFLALLAFSATSNVQAECVQEPADAKTVAIVDGTTGCASLNMQFGCRMDPASGVKSCTAPGLFTARSEISANGTVKWWLDSGYTVKADTALVGGGTGGNACGYFYAKDTTEGSGMGFKKSNGSYANVTYVDVCADLKSDEIQVVNTFPACPQDVQDALDDGTIPGDYAIVGKIKDGDSLSFCVKSSNPEIRITECINEEGKNATGPHPSGRPRCSEGPDQDGDGVLDGPQPFKKELTMPGVKVGNNSCVFYCPPTNYGFGGTSSCWYVCDYSDQSLPF